MLIKEYLINSPKEINKLKKELMEIQDNSTQSFQTNSSALKRFRNAILGQKFEKNIRQTLIQVYGWKTSHINRKIFYREIFIGDQQDILIVNLNKKIIIREKEFTFHLDEENMLTISIKNEEKKLEFKIKNNEETSFPIRSERVIIKQNREIELDGIYKNININLYKFSEEEIEFIYYNVDPGDIGEFNYIITEIKYNKNSIFDLIDQMKKDKMIIERITNKNILFLGFINGNKIDRDIEKKVKEINFILLGVKNSMFNNRDMTECIDWETIKELKSIKKEIKEVKNIFEKEIKKILKKRKRNNSK